MDYTSEFTGPQIDERLGLAGTAYQKPEGGIPEGDLSESVQSSLDKGNTAYQKPETGIPASDLAEGVIPDVSEFITRTVNDLANYYLKSETYTKDEVQNLISSVISFRYEIAPSTSAVTDPKSNVLYLIGPTGTGADKYEEYVYPDAQTGWVKIGDTSIDLSGYVTTEMLNSVLANYQTIANIVTEWQTTPDNNHYPAEKLVYDNLYKPGVISQTQNWANDYGSYTLSDILRGNIPAYFINLWNAAVMDYGTFNEVTGYFELNGLTDLSYEDALRIYNIKQPGARFARDVAEWVGPSYAGIQNYPIFKIRTIIPCVLAGKDVPRLTWNIWIEVSRFIMPRNYAPIFGNIVGYTYGQHRLKRMLDTYKVESAYTLAEFYALEECYFIISANVTASDCKYLSLASVVYMVENATNTSAITITLHAAAYARCVADTTEYTYQGNTYTGIVAYANAKQITIASA